MVFSEWPFRPCQVQLYIATPETFIDWRDMNMLRWKRKLSWLKNKAVSCSLFSAVNSDIWNRLFSSTRSLIFEKVMPVGCSICHLTFKAFIISESWWWPSDRRADSSISYRIRRGQSTLPTSLGNELSFQRQPRFQQVELQNLVTWWNGLSRAAFTSRILGHHWKRKVLVLFQTCFLPAFSDTLRRIQRYKLREREQFSELQSARRAIFILHHLWSYNKEKTLQWAPGLLVPICEDKRGCVLIICIHLKHKSRKAKEFL